MFCLSLLRYSNLMAQHPKSRPRLSLIHMVRTQVAHRAIRDLQFNCRFRQFWEVFLAIDTLGGLPNHRRGATSAWKFLESAWDRLRDLWHSSLALPTMPCSCSIWSNFYSFISVLILDRVKTVLITVMQNK